MKHLNSSELALELRRESPTPRDYHYGEFYKLREIADDLETGHDAAASAPRVAVVGNCQAESLRILLATTGAVRSFRIPPIHEWDEADLPFVRHLLADTDVLISQPVRDNYRDLPCGTDQLAQYLPSHGRVVKFPVLRFNALNPYIAIVRSPQNPSLNPPVVPYHDLRLIAEHAQLSRPGTPDFAGVLNQTVEQLASRERTHGCVSISDTLLDIPVWHTLNHPSNETLAVLARRVLRAIDPQLAEAHEVQLPDEELLGHLQSPIDEQAAQALGAKVRRGEWTDNGEVIDAEEIREAQLKFYEEHPEVVQAALNRHGELLTLLGFEVPDNPGDSSEPAVSAAPKGKSS